ncbi:MAG: PRC-barrel domain-containing protein [Clostridia bacterium]|nr:PRC-barrel domain-containing protein [Clostridia bacterium]
MKASQIYGTKIESADGKTKGYILGISCAEDKIEGYICCNQQENEFFAESAGVKFSEEKITFTLTGKENKNCYRLRLGRAVYTESGKFVGNVEDFVFKGDRITCALIGKRKYPFHRLVIGDAVILKSETDGLETTAKDMFISAIISN